MVLIVIDAMKGTEVSMVCDVCRGKVVAEFSEYRHGAAGVDDAVEDGLATFAKEESAAASKSHELLHLKAEHAKLEQLVARLREAFCAVSPHDETLCK